MEESEHAPKRRKLSHDPQETTEHSMASESAVPSDFANSEHNLDSANGTAVVNDTLENELPSEATQGADASKPLSKNQQKKLRKMQEWEAGRDFRKAKRKKKIQERKARKKEQREQEAKDRKEQGLSAQPIATTRYRKPVRLPVTFMIDCGFDDKMKDGERISLGSQLTRSYSDNSKAPFQAHLYVSSWNGHLKERFDTVLRQNHKNWKGIEFMSEDFVEVAKVADEVMKGPEGGKLASIFTKYRSHAQHDTKSIETTPQADGDVTAPPVADAAAMPSLEQLQSQGEVIYLTSDSPDTLTELKPFSTYIIGGLVDKNRHKGICYKTACDKGIKTAKLPIGEYMEMQSRFVLATNHVNEIMVRYLECGDWGEAFMKVMPKRKGGKLKGEKQPSSEPHPDVDDHQDGNDDGSEDFHNAHDDEDDNDDGGGENEAAKS